MNTKISSKRELQKHKTWNSIQCGNCGKKGHIYKKCDKAVQSLGIILYRIKKGFEDKLPPPSIYSKSKVLFYQNNLEFLLIRRRNTLGYMDFLRGKYSFSDMDFIKSLFNEMTIEERHNIVTKDFLELWVDLWLKKTDSTEKYQLEFTSAESKFQILKKGIILDDGNMINTTSLLSDIKPKWTEAEWEFPKGRRNLREEDIKCACREFTEETGYTSDDYDLCSEFKPIEELFLGSNNVLYKHIYYIGQSNTYRNPVIDPDNYCQSTEIGDIGWFNYETAYNKIRDYSIEKKAVLKKTFNLISY